jgi:hypothetical protein
MAGAAVMAEARDGLRSQLDPAGLRAGRKTLGILIVVAEEHVIRIAWRQFHDTQAPEGIGLRQLDVVKLQAFAHHADGGCAARVMRGIARAMRRIARAARATIGTNLRAAAHMRACAIMSYVNYIPMANHRVLTAASGPNAHA